MRPHRSVFAAAFAAIAIAGASCGGSNEGADPPDSTFTVSTFQLGIGAAVDTLTGATVAQEFAAASKAQPFLGRFLVAADFATSASPVVVLGNEVWMRRFNSQPTVIGSQVRLNGRDAVVVGVMPPGFLVPRGAVLWTPKAAP